MWHDKCGFFPDVSPSCSFDINARSCNVPHSPMSKRVQNNLPVQIQEPPNRRILIVDDNPQIHEDFRKILSPDLPHVGEIEQKETALFGRTNFEKSPLAYELDFAFSGEEAIEKSNSAMDAGKEYALAFVDVRMAPGIDGVQTTQQLLQKACDLQIVICTAYSDYSWDDMMRHIGESDQLLVLKKPFDNIEVLQCASTLCEKWRLQKETQKRLKKFTGIIDERLTKDVLGKLKS
jgi:CheY-like chemotaxis protein